MDYRMPIYLQLQDIIIKRIDDGEYLPGSLIPSEREMAELYQVNRMTVKRAMSELVEKGYLYRVQGKGTFVQKRENRKFDIGLINETDHYGITAMVRASGVRISNKVLTRGVITGNRYLEKQLSLEPGEPIYALHRIRYGNDETIAVEYCYVPEKFFPGIDEINFAEVSLYDFMEARGHRIDRINQRLIVIECGKKEARYLEVGPGQPLYYLEYIGRDKKGNIVEYTENYTRTDKAEFRYNTTM